MTKDELIEFLKDNFKVTTRLDDMSYNYPSQCQIRVDVKLSLKLDNGDYVEISKDFDTLRLNWT